MSDVVTLKLAVVPDAVIEGSPTTEGPTTTESRIFKFSDWTIFERTGHDMMCTFKQLQLIAYKVSNRGLPAKSYAVVSWTPIVYFSAAPQLSFALLNEGGGQLVDAGFGAVTMECGGSNIPASRQADFDPKYFDPAIFAKLTLHGTTWQRC